MGYSAVYEPKACEKFRNSEIPKGGTFRKNFPGDLRLDKSFREIRFGNWPVLDPEKR